MKTPNLIDILQEPTETKASTNLPNPDDFFQPEEADDNFDIFSKENDDETEEETSTGEKELSEEYCVKTHQ